MSFTFVAVKQQLHRHGFFEAKVLRYHIYNIYIYISIYHVIAGDSAIPLGQGRKILGLLASNHGYK